MDKSPILPADHDSACRRSGPGDLDTERCERCRNLFARLDQWRATTGYNDLETTAPGDPPRSEGDAV